MRVSKLQESAEKNKFNNKGPEKLGLINLWNLNEMQEHSGKHLSERLKRTVHSKAYTRLLHTSYVQYNTLIHREASGHESHIERLGPPKFPAMRNNQLTQVQKYNWKPKKWSFKIYSRTMIQENMFKTHSPWIYMWMLHWFIFVRLAEKTGSRNVTTKGKRQTTEWERHKWE